MAFESLPGELYDAILCRIPFDCLQQTTLAVIKALPYAPVPIYHLFRWIRIRHPDQVIKLFQCLRRRQCGGWTHRIAFETYQSDAEIVINILRILPNVSACTIWIGPNNFAPEHLEELLQRRPPNLKALSLRFRPYVEKASYYQFHKGVYFDSSLISISKWPAKSLPELSIVQEPMDPSLVKGQKFAQPIVFFRLDQGLSKLLKSPALSSLASFRLQIPSRPILRSLCPNPTAESNFAILTLPYLTFLDLSTCGVLDSEIDTILVRFPSLHHLVLDDCQLMRGNMREGDWHALGKKCALTGVKRAKEREKTLRLFLESQIGWTPNSLPSRAKKKAGRKGLASATISLRESKPSLTLTSTSNTGSIAPARGRSRDRDPLEPSHTKTRIFPCSPRLRSLCICLSESTEEKSILIRNEFKAGWSEGLASLNVIRARLKKSSANGVHLVQFISGHSSLKNQDEWGEAEKGWEDLEEFGVSEDEEEAFTALMDEMTDPEPPVLCFAGKADELGHAHGCAHSVGEDFW